MEGSQQVRREELRVTMQGERGDCGVVMQGLGKEGR